MKKLILAATGIAAIIWVFRDNISIFLQSCDEHMCKVLGVHYTGKI